MPASTAAAHVLYDRLVDVETPEHVGIGYELADLGSRFTAMLLDFLLIIAVQLGTWALLSMTLWAVGAPQLEGVGLAVGAMVAFLMQWGYFVLFEGLRDGQTLGKRWMGIRVVHDGGYPLTLQGAAVRNLIRIVDVQPGISCVFGGISMSLHPQTKRLGDLAAGTVVVRDRAGQRIPEEADTAGDASLGPPRLSEAEFSALTMFEARRRDLTQEVRVQLARTLLGRLDHVLADDPRRNRMATEEFLLATHADEVLRRQASGAGGRAGSAQATVLVRRQRAEWEEYRALLDDARKRGLRSLDETVVSRFASLYRGVAADLARARTYGGSPELLYTLERSVGNGHNLLYRVPARSWRRLREWAMGGFPALVRRRWRALALASALLYIPCFVSFAYVRADPDRARELVAAEMMARAEEASSREAAGKQYVDMPEVMMPAMASRIISNNVQVTFVAFAGGILAGLGTVFVLIFNGVHLGSVAAVFANKGQSLHLWSFVLPHGVVEMTAISIAGAAGLILGSAILLPGRQTRREAMVERGREAISLVGGAAMMLLVAGTIEGFISPSELPRVVKFTFAAVMALLLIVYLVTAGRGREAGASESSSAR